MKIIKTLNDIFTVEQPGEPKMLFFVVPRGVTHVEGAPQIDAHLVSYVSMNQLSKELQDKIREELKIKQKGPLLVTELPK